MSLRLTVLASGSTGNATLLVCDGNGATTCVLIDAGLSARATRLLMQRLGLALEQLDGIVLTHLDHDHFNRGWPKACKRFGIPVHCSRRHARRLYREVGPREFVTPFDGPFSLGTVSFDPISLAHDALGTMGYLVEHDGVRLGYATDLGRISGPLLERFTDLDALAIESNYDQRMQVKSPRPWFLKNRIMGGAGHLSNDQCCDAVRAIAERSRLQHIVLLHLSQECNRPEIVERLYRERVPHLSPLLRISRHDRPTPWIEVRARSAPRVPMQTGLLFA